MLHNNISRPRLSALRQGHRLKYTVAPVVLMILLSVTGCLDDDDPKLQSGTRLRSYTEYFNLGETDEDTRLNVSYEYDDSGKLQRYTVKGYDPQLDELTQQHFYTFTYNDARVSHIEGFHSGSSTRYVAYDYHYGEEGLLLMIQEDNHSAQVTSSAVFTYSENELDKVAYSYSNGQSFDYEVDYLNENISTDKTTRGSELCSNGKYTYDNHHNPFKELGYVDYLLTNLSSNNRVTESVEYIACAFPSLVPESYTYDYNEDGYPIRRVTTYKSSGAVRKSTREYFYDAK